MKNSDEKRLLVKRINGELGTYHLTALSPRDLSEIREESFDLPFLHQTEDIDFNCCEGLLCIYEVSGHIYLCNPTTKQFQFFPTEEACPFFKNSTTLVAACVCYDSKSDDYKILRVIKSINRRTYETFELYSLRQNSWTEVGSPRREGCYLNSFSAIPVGGKCYWFVGDCDMVASFDCIEASFSYFDLPPNSDHFYCELVQFNGGDSLGVVRIKNYEPGHYYELWVWKEDLLLWNRELNVSLGGALTGAQGTIYGSFFFLRGIAGKPDELTHRLVAYDWNKKVCMELGIYNSDFRTDVLCYVESTVVLPHSICGSGFLNNPCVPFVKDKDEDEDNVMKLALDDFYKNGFRILNDIAKEEEKQVF
ncbi:uncharacterized protein LOC131016090 isoform X2 [Salvia miltiorrhiza]|uniref:uncharacterized protein LOC131016090 isoform X2 n=1 Tax=Salvia miltiorrhiza TaxID=226208 RepID=UPI0025AD7EFB|nr:uncharacterized protein LOC131016090 isoform X2 [Salvia miltiorrhiza]